MRVCKTCGLPEDEHHEPDWITRPAGCVCDVREWRGPVIPPACESYDGDGVQNCKKCEHDLACHKGAK